MATIVHIFTKVYFDRAKKDVFEKIKENTVSKNAEIGKMILKAARMRMRNGLGIWNKSAQERERTERLKN
jgi:hypothetical protein